MIKHTWNDMNIRVNIYMYVYDHPYSGINGQTENGVAKTAPSQFIPV